MGAQWGEREDAPAIRLVNLLLVDAIKRGASCLYLEPVRDQLAVFIQIDEREQLVELFPAPLPTSCSG